MHKGRLYELAQPLRVMAGDATYPHWWANKMSCGTIFWSGSYSSHVSTGAWDCDYFWVDQDAGTFEYRGPVPSTGGKDVEIGIQCELSPDKTTIITNAQVWVDGVEQMDRSQHIGWVPKYQVCNSNVAFPLTKPGFVLAWGDNFGGGPVPY